MATPQNIQKALDAGYTQREITEYLSRKHKFNLDKALEYGYTYDEVLPWLASRSLDRPQAAVDADAAPAVAPQAMDEGQEAGREGGGVLRGLGLGTRSVIEGSTGLADTALSPIRWGLNKTNALLGGDADYFKPMSQAVSDMLHLPTPESDQEKLYHNIQSAAASVPFSYGAGAALQAGRALTAAPSVARGVGTMLTEAPGMQLASAAAGGAASSLAESAGAGPAGQLMANIAGGIVPTVPRMGADALRRSFGKKINQDKYRAFQQSGIEPASLGAVSDSGVVQRLESGLEQNLFSSGVMRDATERGKRSLTKAVDDAAERISGGAAYPDYLEGMGTLARVQGEAGRRRFQDRSSVLADRAYGPIDAAPARLDNTLGSFKQEADLLSPHAGVDLENTLIRQLGPIYDDNALKQLNVRALRKHTSKVGRRVKAQPTASPADADQGELKRIYGALKQDIDEAAKAAGGSKELDRFNRWYRQRKEAHKNVDKVFFNNKDGIATANAIHKAEGNQLRDLYRVVGPEGYKRLRAAALATMARDKDGMVSAAQLSTILGKGTRAAQPGAQRMLLGKKDAERLRTIARAYEESRLYSNTSNTAGANEVIALLKKFGPTAGAGYFGGIPGLLASGVVPYGAARAMTSPNVIRTLAEWGKSNIQPLRNAAAPAGVNSVRGLLQLLAAMEGE